MRILTVFLLLCLPMSLLEAGPVKSAQQPQFGQAQQREEPISPEIERKMAKQRKKERYDNIKRDSERLLELATELKQYVDKSGENTLSMDVIKKCEEIEKLSKSVRTKMKGE